MELRRSITLLAGSALAGALVFWIPAMLLRAASGSPGPGLLVVSVVGPLSVRWAAVALERRFRGCPGVGWLAEALLAGIWLTGPLFTMAAVWLGGELSLERAGVELRDLYAYPPLVPLVTLVFSGSDGSLIGLLIASCVLAYTSAELRPEYGTPRRSASGAELRWTRLEFTPTARCMVCATELEDGQPTHTCPLCDASLHSECHAYLGGCARFGCPGVGAYAPRTCTSTA